MGACSSCGNCPDVDGKETKTNMEKFDEDSSRGSHVGKRRASNNKSTITIPSNHTPTLSTKPLLRHDAAAESGQLDMMQSIHSLDPKTRQMIAGMNFETPHTPTPSGPLAVIPAHRPESNHSEQYEYGMAAVQIADAPISPTQPPRSPLDAVIPMNPMNPINTVSPKRSKSPDTATDDDRGKDQTANIEDEVMRSPPTPFQKGRGMYRPGTTTEWADQQITAHYNEMSKELEMLKLNHMAQHSGSRGYAPYDPYGRPDLPVVYHGQRDEVMAMGGAGGGGGGNGTTPIGGGGGPRVWDEADVEMVREQMLNQMAHLEQIEKRRQSLTADGMANLGKVSPDSTQ